VEHHFSYRLKPQDRWVRRKSRTTTAPALPPVDLRSAWVWEDQTEILFIETLAAIETCTRLIAQCASDLHTMEQRLYGLQQSRKQAYMLEALAVAGRLSRRELQVLRLAAQELSNQAIGVSLGISHGTVKNHMTSILAKLGVRNRRDATIKARALGLI